MNQEDICGKTSQAEGTVSGWLVKWEKGTWRRRGQEAGSESLLAKMMIAFYSEWDEKP